MSTRAWVAFAIAATLCVIGGVLVGGSFSGSGPTGDTAADVTATAPPTPDASSSDAGQPIATGLVDNAEDLLWAISQGVERVELAAGVIDVSTLRIGRSVELVGAGIDQTVLRSADAASIVHIEGATVTLSGMTVESVAASEASDSTAGVTAIDAIVTIDRVRIEGAPGHGLHLTDSEAMVVGSAFSGNAWDGVRSDGSSSVEISASESIGNGWSGFSWADDAAGRSWDNVAIGNKTVGFDVADRAAPDLEGNEASRNAEAGFRWSGEAAGSATENSANANDGPGYLLEASPGPALDRNESDGAMQTAEVVPSPEVEEQGAGPDAQGDDAPPTTPTPPPRPTTPEVTPTPEPTPTVTASCPAGYRGFPGRCYRLVPPVLVNGSCPTGQTVINGDGCYAIGGPALDDGGDPCRAVDGRAKTPHDGNCWAWVSEVPQVERCPDGTETHTNGCRDYR